MKKLFLLVLILPFIYLSCSKDNSTDKPFISVDKKTIIFRDITDNQTQTIHIKSNLKWIINGYKNSWVSLNVEQGDGDAKIDITAHPDKITERESELTIYLKAVDIPQLTTTVIVKSILKPINVLDSIADNRFKDYLMYDIFDGKEFISIEEAKGVTEIDISRERSKNNPIYSLKGLKYFTELKILNLENNLVTDLDVSKNVKLIQLNASNNKLNALDISKNTELAHLYCSENRIKILDISKNTKLTEFVCAANLLEELKVSKNPNLEILNCSTNRIKDLDVSENIQLVNLLCGSNELDKLDVSMLNNLRELECMDGKISKLNISNNLKLENLVCSYNYLTELDTSNNKELKSLSCLYNKLTKLDLCNNTKLTYFEGFSNNWSEKSIKIGVNTFNSAKLSPSKINGNYLVVPLD